LYATSRGGPLILLGAGRGLEGFYNQVDQVQR
jgi:hypothetical protein